MFLFILYRKNLLRFVAFSLFFYEVLKLQSFEFDVSDIILTNAEIISPLYFLHILVNFMEKDPLTMF